MHSFKNIQSPFLWLNIGFVLTVCSLLIGHLFSQTLYLTTGKEVPEKYANTREGEFFELPFTVRLVDFQIQRENAAIKQYRSTLEIKHDNGHNYTAEISVNHPFRMRSWWIYQYGYDTSGEGRYTQLLLVRDPLVYLTYAGMILIILSAVALIFRKEQK